MNKVIQVVRLANDPEVSTYGDGKSRVTFGGYVAKRYKKDKDEKDNSFNYVAFGATADFIGKYFKKGSQMLITGEINNNNYEKDGVKHYSVQILVEAVEFFGKKEDGKTDSGESGEKKSEAKAEAKAETKASDSYYDAYEDF